MQIPQLSYEQKSQLIMELTAYAVTRDRIWAYDAPSVALAKLIAAIYMDKRISTYRISYLRQELNKVPELYNRLKPYMQSTYTGKL